MFYFLEKQVWDFNEFASKFEMYQKEYTAVRVKRRLVGITQLLFLRLN